MASKYLKICAKALCAIGIISSIVLGCVIYDSSVILSLLIILLGSLLSIAGMFLLHTWAEFVNTQRQMLFIISVDKNIKIPKDVTDDDFLYIRDNNERL